MGIFPGCHQPVIPAVNTENKEALRMKIRWLVFVALILGIISAHAIKNAAAGDPLSGKAVKIEGSPQLLRGGEKSTLTKTTIVNSGDTIITGPRDSLILKLNTGDVIVIAKITNFKLTAGSLDKPAMSLDLKQGAVWAKVKKPQTGDRVFEVKTPTAIAGVRGTSFSATVESDKKSWFCICEGRLSISREGKTSDAKQGEAVVSDTSLKKPAPDAKLLEHPGEFTQNCLSCHQGGYKRDSVY
jgi:hypothetical protein